MKNIDIYTILLLGLGLSVILLLLYIYSLIRVNLRYSKKLKVEMQLKEYEININTNENQDLLEFLDNIIETIFNEYILLNIECQKVEYIDTELEISIVKEVSEKVISSISPILLTKLSLIYNYDKIPEIIGNRVYLHVINYTISKNKAKEN